ncbi:MAG: hypothetical protein QOE23_395 [Pseudonocardiales bacterium]|nr:hypothetical protein [Pseudonocardiales bacterium]
MTLPLGACAAALSLLLLGMEPVGDVRTDSQRRPAGSAPPTTRALGQPFATPTPSATDRPTASATSSKATKAAKAAKAAKASKAATPSRSRTPESARAEAAPPISRVPVDGPGIQAAADYATSRGYRVGLAVLDTRTGKLWGASEHASLFASESVVKVFIATRLLLAGQLTGSAADTAFRMIARSDDGAADALYGYAGGDDVLPWIAAHYGIANLGTPPIRDGWWSNTHISAAGLVQFYAKVKADPVVWPWLSKAMHAATGYGSDGTYQFFGLKQADPNAAIKQGWGQDDDDWSASSDFNSTGFVNGDRYAVAILLKGPSWQYRTGVPAMVSSVARRLMPGGVLRP